jgi:hypothetical protein
VGTQSGRPGSLLRFWITNVLGILALSLMQSTKIEATPPDQFQPDVTVNLREFGYEELKGRRDQLQPNVGPFQPAAFLDNDILAVSFLVKNPNPGLSVRGKIYAGPVQLQTVFLNANSGKTVRTQRWAGCAMGCGLFPARNGSFVIWHDREFDLHSQDGKLMKTLALDPDAFPRMVQVKQSPSGDTLFAIRSDVRGHHVLPIRVENLQKGEWLELPGYFEGAGSDSSFAFSRSGTKEINPPMDVFIGPIARPNPRESTRIFTSSPGCFSLVFLDEAALAVSGGCPTLTILRTSGEVVYQRKFDRVLTGRITTCRNCDLIVLSTFTLNGGSERLDIPAKGRERSLVFFNRRTTDLVELPRTGITKALGGIALSPNGCVLVIQNEGRVEFHRLCDSPLREKLHVDLPSTPHN